MVIKFLVSGFLLLLMSACVTKKSQIGIVEKNHSVFSDEFRILMREVNSSLDDRHESELERDSIRRRYALKLSSNIKNLSKKIQEIPREELSKDISDKDMEFFQIYIKRLNKNAQTLEDVANNYELEKLEPTINNMKRTCKACHTRLRISK